MLFDVVKDAVSSKLASFESQMGTLQSPEDNVFNSFALHYLRENFRTDGVDALQEWTGKASATVVYDSTVDEFTAECLFQSVKGKPNIALVGFTTDGDVFGGFYSVAVDRQGLQFSGANMFAFSLFSGWRCKTPQKFALKEGVERAYVSFYTNDRNGFVLFEADCQGGFTLGNERSNSWCWDMSNAFEGLNNTTLTGQNNSAVDNGVYHHCTRLVAVQLL